MLFPGHTSLLRRAADTLRSFFLIGLLGRQKGFGFVPRYFFVASSARADEAVAVRGGVISQQL
jgi:hypothetical protein